MKNKLLKRIITFILCMVFITNVYALTAKSPATVPSVGDELYSMTDETFDYSAISFTTNPAGGQAITGKSGMRKILLSSTASENGLGSDWFSAYCLNGLAKYPSSGYINYKSNVNLTTTVKFNHALETALFKISSSDSTLSNLFLANSGYISAIIDYDNISETDMNTFLTGNYSTSSIVVSINKITFCMNSTCSLKNEITAQQLIEAKNGTYTAGDKYSFTLKLADGYYDVYTTIEMPSSTLYNQMLWIIEHSYPNISISSVLEDAGTTYSKLLSDIKLLHTGETHSDSEWDAIVENYVYSTIQYALWSVEGNVSEVQGTSTYKLGSTLVGSDALNKLYQYLIKERDYTNYASFNFDGSITLNKPADDKILYKEETSLYKYGPYSVTGGMITMGDISLSITNSNKTGIKIVDKAGNEIGTVRQEEEFYITVTKASKVSNVSIKIDVQNGARFNPATNRGRIYSSKNVLQQNVASGGKIEAVSKNVTFDLVYNPKTGAEDLVLILSITMVSFALGYLVLKVKNQPVEL